MTANSFLKIPSSLVVVSYAFFIPPDVKAHKYGEGDWCDEPDSITYFFKDIKFVTIRSMEYGCLLTHCFGFMPLPLFAKHQWLRTGSCLKSPTIGFSPFSDTEGKKDPYFFYANLRYHIKMSMNLINSNLAQ